MADEKTYEFSGLSLADLTGIDLAGIESKRFGEILPKMAGEWTFRDYELRAIDGGGAFLTMKMTTDKCIKILDKEYLGTPDGSEIVGKREHNETFMLKSTENVSYMLGWFEDCGVKKAGGLEDIAKSAIGKRVQGVISHRKDKNDADKVYSGLTKQKPLN